MESEDTQWRGIWKMRSGVQNLVFFPLTNFCLHFIQGPRQKLLLSDCQGLPLLITVTISERKQLKRRMDVPGLYPNSTRPIVAEISRSLVTVEPPNRLASSEPGRKRKKMRKKKRWKRKMGRRMERWWWWWRGRVRVSYILQWHILRTQLLPSSCLLILVMKLWVCSESIHWENSSSHDSSIVSPSYLWKWYLEPNLDHISFPENPSYLNHRQCPNHQCYLFPEAFTVIHKCLESSQSLR